VLVTGGTGFIGSHVVRALLARGVPVTVLCRDAQKAGAMPWSGQVEFVQGDLARLSPKQLDHLAGHGRILHLAWEHLNAYKSNVHEEEVLPRHQEFLTQLISRGAKRLLVSGTCLEYGLREGALTEELAPQPTTAYGRAKDALRRALEPLCAESGTALQWVRLFYMHGPGQSEKSLLSQLDRAIQNNMLEFDMSGGEQLRDYLPVEDVADILVRVTAQSVVTGVINCASGHPVTVRALVEAHLRLHRAAMRLNLGRYPYPDYEPMSFWGDTTKLAAALAAGDAQDIRCKGIAHGKDGYRGRS